jgi:hypothetical protein
VASVPSGSNWTPPPHYTILKTIILTKHAGPLWQNIYARRYGIALKAVATIHIERSAGYMGNTADRLNCLETTITRKNVEKMKPKCLCNITQNNLKYYTLNCTKFNGKSKNMPLGHLPLA